MRAIGLVFVGVAVACGVAIVGLSLAGDGDWSLMQPLQLGLIACLLIAAPFIGITDYRRRKPAKPL